MNEHGSSEDVAVQAWLDLLPHLLASAQHMHICYHFLLVITGSDLIALALSNIIGLGIDLG